MRVRVEGGPGPESGATRGPAWVEGAHAEQQRPAARGARTRSPGGRSEQPGGGAREHGRPRWAE